MIMMRSEKLSRRQSTFILSYQWSGLFTTSAQRLVTASWSCIRILIGQMVMILWFTTSALPTLATSTISKTF